LQLIGPGMIDALDTDRIEVSGFEETDPGRCILALETTAEIVLEQAFDETLDLDEVASDRRCLLRARTQPDWPPVPRPPKSRSRRQKAVYSVVSRAQTSSDS